MYGVVEKGIAASLALLARWSVLMVLGVGTPTHQPTHPPHAEPSRVGQGFQATREVYVDGRIKEEP